MTIDHTLGRLDDDYPLTPWAEPPNSSPPHQDSSAPSAKHASSPLRSAGGRRRYSRYQLRIAARARELVDEGTPVEAACRIVILEDPLEEAQRINAEYHRATGSSKPPAAA